MLNRLATLKASIAGMVGMRRGMSMSISKQVPVTPDREGFEALDWESSDATIEEIPRAVEKPRMLKGAIIVDDPLKPGQDPVMRGRAHATFKKSYARIKSLSRNRKPRGTPGRAYT